MARGESPYSRLGTAVAGEQAPERVPLDGRRSIFAVAWAATGEWRDWRALLDASDVDDPFDLAGITHPSALAMVAELVDLDEASIELVDFTAELGRGLTVHAASPALVGRATLTIEDTAEGAYTIALTAPGDDAPGEAVALTDADFADLTGEPRSVRLLLWSARQRAVCDVEMGRDAFTILWFARSIELAFAPVPTRSTLIVPEPELLV